MRRDLILQHVHTAKKTHPLIHVIGEYIYIFFNVSGLQLEFKILEDFKFINVEFKKSKCHHGLRRHDSSTVL